MQCEQFFDFILFFCDDVWLFFNFVQSCLVLWVAKQLSDCYLLRVGADSVQALSTRGCEQNEIITVKFNQENLTGGLNVTPFSTFHGPIKTT